MRATCTHVPLRTAHGPHPRSGWVSAGRSCAGLMKPVPGVCALAGGAALALRRATACTAARTLKRQTSTRAESAVCRLAGLAFRYLPFSDASTWKGRGQSHGAPACFIIDHLIRYLLTMESDSQAPPAPRDGAPTCSDAALLEVCSLNNVTALCAPALAMPSVDKVEASNGHSELGLSEAEARNGHSELGLSEAAQLAYPSLLPGCVLGESDAHLDNVGDVIRHALLLEVRGSSSYMCFRLHFHVGHSDCL